MSCTAWALDYLLFHADASFIPPTYHHSDPRTEEGRKKLLASVPWTQLYDETGVHNTTNSTLFQLAVEKFKRIKRADHLMPIADGFNFLLSGVPCVEKSSASATQLYNPATNAWSELLLSTLKLPPNLLPPVVSAGTKLKPLRPEIGKATKLETPQIIASCSNELAATLVGLPVNPDESWAFLRLGANALVGTEHPESVRTELGRDAGFSNITGYGNCAVLHKHTVGLWILEECRRHWAGVDSGLEDGVIAHLAASSPALESFINFDDPRFATPGDMPLKIRAYCKETNQVEPRKPGPVVRCVLESLALHYRKALQELSILTGREFTQLYLLGDSSNTLLNHFISNALQIPLVIAQPDTTAIGNIVVQAIATGHIKSLPEGRQIIRQSFKTTTVQPYAVDWSPAYDRFTELTALKPESTPA
jgi:rhamnulokinase